MKTVYEILMKLSGANQTNDGLNSAEKNVNLLTQAADAVAPALISAGDAMLSFSDRAYQANANMERGLTNLQNITGSTRAQMEQYNRDLEGVLETTGYQISANDLLGASYDAASAGFTDTADAMGVMEEAAKLAIAGNSGLGAATDNMASSQKAVIAGLKSYGAELEQYGGTADRAAVVSDKMYKIIKLGITDIKQLAPEFAELAPTAAAAGLSMDELAGSYAAMTSAGIKTNIATTNLKALLSSIARGGGTKESKELIDALGLSFNSAGLEADGLVGILADLQAKGIDTFDEYLKLTGSVEAATALAALSAQDLGDKVSYISDEAANLQDKVDALADDPMGKLTESTERFDRALALAGENLAPIESTLLNLATEVLDAFNELPEPLQKVIGSFVVMGGVTAKVGGSTLQLASNIAVARIAYMSFASQLAATTVAKGSATKSTGLLTIAQGKLTAAVGLTNASLATLAATAGIALAAIAALTAGYLHYQNIQTENKNNALSEAYQETEVLAQKATELGIRMRETGKALPDKEFQQWIALLEQADGGTGVLRLQIEALTRVQEEAKAGTLESAKATQEKANADGASAKQTKTKAQAEQEAKEAAEAQAEAARLQEEANQALFETLKNGLETTRYELTRFNQELDNQIEAGTITTQEAYEQRAKGLELYATATREAYREVLSAETLTAEQRKQLETEQTRALEANQQERLVLHRQWTQELEQINREQIQIERDKLDILAKEQGWSQEKLTQEHKSLKKEQLEATVTTLEAELSAVVQGSQRQREISSELYATKAELGRMAVQEVEDQARAEEEAIRKAAQRKKEVWEQETALYITELNERASQAKSIADRTTNALQAQSSLGNIAGGELGNFEAGYQAEIAAKERIRDITEQINKLEEEQRETGESRKDQISKLTGELQKQKQIQELTQAEQQKSLNLLKAMGVSVQGNLTADKQAFELAKVKLNLENQQLTLKLRQETIANRLKVLEQDRLILELQRKATAEDITAAETRNLQLQIRNAEQAKALIREQQTAAETLTGFQQQSNASAARVGLATQGIDPKELGAEFKDANKTLSKELGGSLGQDLGKVEAATGKGALTVSEALGSQTLNLNGGLTGVTEGVVGAVNPLNSRLETVSSGLDTGFGASVAATQAQTQELRDQLQALESAMNAVPDRIAASLPRSEPTTRN